MNRISSAYNLMQHFSAGVLILFPWGTGNTGNSLPLINIVQCHGVGDSAASPTSTNAALV